MPEFYRYTEQLMHYGDSEKMHHMAREALHLAESMPLGIGLRIAQQFAYGRERYADDRLNVVLGGIIFDNPVMVGAGWDKEGRSLVGLHTLGFSAVEVGTVVKYPQPGNPKPRQFVIGPGVALNRLGFNSPGMHVVKRNLTRYRDTGCPIGISLGKNKDVPIENAPQVHADVAELLYPYASYFAINVSSPNTPGLRDLQDKGPLTDIVQAVQSVMDTKGARKPLFVKIAPDLTMTAVDDVIEVVLEQGLSGIIATNTTNSKKIKAKYGCQGEGGGISGNDAEYRAMATDMIRHIYRVTQGRVEIIGVGGIHDTATALEKIQAGARVVQVVTAIREVGPTLPGRINRGLVQWMQEQGVNNIAEVIGTELA